MKVKLEIDDRIRIKDEISSESDDEIKIKSEIGIKDEKNIFVKKEIKKELMSDEDFLADRVPHWNRRKRHTYA